MRTTPSAWFVGLAVVTVSACTAEPSGAPAATPSAPPAIDCAVTDPATGPTPPAGIVREAGTAGAFYGRDDLWVLLPDPATARRHYQTSGPPYGLKLPWIRLGVGRIELYADRVDNGAARVAGEVLDGYGDTGFQSSAIRVPEAGCWRVTGRLNATDVVIVWRFGP